MHPVETPEDMPEYRDDTEAEAERADMENDAKRSRLDTSFAELSATALRIKAERDELRRYLAEIVRYHEDTEFAEAKEREALEATDGNVGALEAIVGNASAYLARIGR